MSNIARRILREDPDLIEFESFPRGTKLKEIRRTSTFDGVRVTGVVDYTTAVAYEARRERILNHIPECLKEPEYRT